MVRFFYPYNTERICMVFSLGWCVLVLLLIMPPGVLFAQFPSSHIFGRIESSVQYRDGTYLAEGDYLTFRQYLTLGYQTPVIDPGLLELRVRSSILDNRSSQSQYHPTTRQWGYYDFTASFLSRRAISFELYGNLTDSETESGGYYQENVSTSAIHGLNIRLTDVRFPSVWMGISRRTMDRELGIRTTDQIQFRLQQTFHRESRIRMQYRQTEISDESDMRSLSRQWEFDGHATTSENGNIRTQNYYRTYNNLSSFYTINRFDYRFNQNHRLLTFLDLSYVGSSIAVYTHRIGGDYQWQISPEFIWGNEVNYSQTRTTYNNGRRTVRDIRNQSSIDFNRNIIRNFADWRIAGNLTLGSRTHTDYRWSGDVNHYLLLEMRRGSRAPWQWISQVRESIYYQYRELDDEYSFRFQQIWFQSLYYRIVRWSSLESKVTYTQQDGNSFSRSIDAIGEWYLMPMPTLTVIQIGRMNRRFTPLSRSLYNYQSRIRYRPKRHLSVALTGNWSMNSRSEYQRYWVDMTVDYRWRKMEFYLKATLHRSENSSNDSRRFVEFRVTRPIG